MNERQVERVRRICVAMPEAEERLSHGEPTFFVRKKVFAMMSNDHHGDGHVAVVLAAPPGLQEQLVAEAPAKFYRPPYVGHRGWIGVEIDAVDDDELASLVHEAWRLIAPKRLVMQADGAA